MAACTGNLECAFHVLLTFYIGEIVVEKSCRTGEFGTCVDDRRSKFRGSAQKVDDVGKTIDSVDSEIVDHGGFGGIVARHYHAFEALPARLYGHGQHAAHGAHAAVERQFAHNDVVRQGWSCYYFSSYEGGYGDRQIVGGSLFTNVGRRHVDSHRLSGQPVARLFECRAHPFMAFLDSSVRQTYYAVVYTPVDYSFDRHYYGINAADGGSVGFDEHGAFFCVLWN